jgi:hypothetical protein
LHVLPIEDPVLLWDDGSHLLKWCKDQNRQWISTVSYALVERDYTLQETLLRMAVDFVDYVV